MPRSIKPERQRLLAKIHIGKKELGMDDDMYRDALWTVTRVRSAKQLDTFGLQKMLNYMKGCGFKVKKPVAAKNYPGRPHNTDAVPQLGKIEALLADMNLPWAYADSVANQMFEIKKVAWLDQDQRGALITALVRKQKATEMKP